MTAASKSAWPFPADTVSIVRERFTGRAMAERPRRRLRAYHLLLLVPLAILWVPLYNRTEPALAGIPFFYWYQMAWIAITVVLILIVYRLDRRTGSGP